MLLPNMLPYCLFGLVFATIPSFPNASQRPLQAVLASKRPPFKVGDTVYVAASVLNIRPQPKAEGFEESYVVRNARGTIIALLNSNWARVLFTSEDVGVDGYVSQWYLAKEKKNHSSNRLLILNSARLRPYRFRERCDGRLVKQTCLLRATQ